MQASIEDNPAIIKPIFDQLKENFNLNIAQDVN